MAYTELKLSFFGLALLITVKGCTGELNSCFVEWFVHAGISYNQSLIYEENAIRSQIDIYSMKRGIHPGLEASRDDTPPIILCLLQLSSACAQYNDPCFNGGTCQLTNGSAYECQCAVGYTGHFCRTPQDQVIVENLRTQVAAIANDMEIQNGKTKLLGTSCNLRTIGYKYQSQHNLFQENDVGQLASITITKKRSDTVLKLSYSSSIRTQGALAATRWYFQIDGQECRKPTPIDIGMWQETADNTHVPAVLTGICESIAKNGA
eukprot:scpid98157/ scgid27710/ Collagen triple helix repeat-containing protein 1